MAWHTERDWTTRAGLRAVCGVVSYGGKLSHRCGYVAVPRGHPLFGVSYNKPTPRIPRARAEGATVGKKSIVTAVTAGVDAYEGEDIRRSPDVVFDCHGGLTYAGNGYADFHDVSLWWFGFDCMHLGDAKIEGGFCAGEVVRSQEYVEAECELLARQIAEMEYLEGPTDD